jgi:hypothetical protein
MLLAAVVVVCLLANLLFWMNRRDYSYVGAIIDVVAIVASAFAAYAAWHL